MVHPRNIQVSIPRLSVWQFFDINAPNDINTHNYTVQFSGPNFIANSNDSSCLCRATQLTAQNGSASLCSDSSDERGKNQKIVSFSLFGNNELYTGGFRRNLQSVKNNYPGYIMRLYHNYEQNSSMMKTMCEVFCDEPLLDLCDIKGEVLKYAYSYDLTKVPGRMWRFLPMADPLVSEFHSRDIDSNIIPREIAAVQEWNRSNALYHVLRDHPNHRFKILAGMFGMKLTGQNRQQMSQILDDMMKDGTGRFYELSDQDMLGKHLFPAVSAPNANTVVHDSYYCELFKIAQNRPFPTRRNTSEDFKEAALYNFVASVHGKLVIPEFRECPKACRPKEHQDWILC